MYLKSGRFVFACALLCLLACAASAFQSNENALADARKALYAARYDQAVDLYRKCLGENASASDAYYGLVRALLRSHHSQDAIAAADEALRRAPGTAGTEAAAGMASFRRGDLQKAEEHFRAAVNLDGKYPGGLVGLASIYSTVSKFKTAQQMRLNAFRFSPDDPDLMLAHANTLTGADHIAALEQVLAIYNASSEEAHNLRAHIQTDRALGDRKLRRLVSPYQASRIKMQWIYYDPKRILGAGIRVQINQKQSVLLMLDTGASGISLSPKTAEKAGLEMLHVETTEAKGVGDEQPQQLQRYIASEVRAGDVVFADVPVAIFRSARTADFDGLIGADVFQRFLVTIDFFKLEMSLEPRPHPEPESSTEPEDASDTPPAGFHRAFRFGNHLALFTSVNRSQPRLFLIDSGSSSSLIDSAIAHEVASVYKDERVKVRGIQGKVNDTAIANHVSLVFAGFQQDNSAVYTFNFDKMNDTFGVGLGGVLGFPVLQQLRVSIDYRDGVVRFEKAR